jgi:hypothetical protein
VIRDGSNANAWALLVRPPSYSAEHPLEQIEKRGGAEQKDQDQPRAKQPVWDAVGFVDGNHSQKNDQGDASTLN